MIQLEAEVEPNYWLSSIIRADYVDRAYLVAVTTYVRLESGQRVMIAGKAKTPDFNLIPSAIQAALVDCKANVVRFQQDLANKKEWARRGERAVPPNPRNPPIEGLDLSGIDL